VALLAGAAPASAALPPPAVAVSPPAPTGAVDVFGENAAGDVFFNRPTADPRGAVRHADGTITALGKTLSGRGDMGPDGRLWLPIDGALWAFAADGTSTPYPITTTAGTLSTALSEVRTGIDGRIWFLDNKVYRTGSIATDGTGGVAFPVPGDRGLEHIARGNDGRMWITRSTGIVHAVTPAGVVSTYGSVGKPVDGLGSNPSGVYAVAAGRLQKIAPTGGISSVSLPVASSAYGAPVSSGGWIWYGNATVISPSGRIIQFSMPVDYDLHDLQGGNLFTYPDRVAVAPSLAGGFVGVVGPSIVRIPNPDVGVNLKVRTSIVSSRGANWLHVVATARTPGGAPVSGSYQVRIAWNRYIPDGFTYIERLTRRVGAVEVRNGTGTVDIPITPSMVAGTPEPYTLDHGNCCAVLLRTTEGLSSVSTGYGDLDPSSTMAYLDRMNGRALGRSMDTAGLVYWAAKMAAGTPRVTVTKSIVDSTAWRRQRVTAAYQRWLGRKPDANGLEYWQNWLKGHTTSDLDFQLGTTAAGRDAGGTSNAARGKHLAAALRLASASASGFTKQLDQGTPWSTLVRTAYFSNSAAQRRMTDLAPRSAYTPSLSAQVAEFRSSRDERGPLVKALATMP
jgi:hypothetical protein